MKKDIIITCDYSELNLKLFKELEKCSNDELKEIMTPLFSEVCDLTIKSITKAAIDVGAFAGGFIGLTMSLDDEVIPGKENVYHSDMIMFLDIRAKDYNQDPERQSINLENEEHNIIFSTNLYPIFLKDERDYQPIEEMSVRRLWALIIRMKPKQTDLKQRLQRRDEVKKLLQYR